MFSDSYYFDDYQPVRDNEDDFDKHDVDCSWYMFEPCDCGWIEDDEC